MKTSTLVLVLSLLFFLSALDARADSHLSADPRVEKARALLNEGRYLGALSILVPYAKSHPDRHDVQFLVGLASIEASRQLPADREKEKTALLDEAIAVLRAMLVDDPSLVRVRLELARAFFYKEDDGLARRHFERVLAGDPPPAVAANVRRFLFQIRARRRWSMRLGLALAPDTNIGSSSDQRTIYLFGLPFRRNQEDLTKSGVGLAVWGGWEYQHPLGDRLRLRAGVDGTLREYSAREFDKMLLSVHAGPRVLATRNTEFSVLGSARQQWSAGRRDFLGLGGRLSVRQRLARRLTLNGTASWHDRRYRRSKSQDGPVQSYSLRASFLLRPTVRLSLTGGYGSERPGYVRNRSENRMVQAGVSLALPRGFTVGFDAGYRWTDYRRWFYLTPTGQHRADETYDLRASVFNRAFTLLGFSPQLSVVREVRTSNAQAHGYKRTSGELRFVRQF